MCLGNQKGINDDSRNKSKKKKKNDEKRIRDLVELELKRERQGLVERNRSLEQDVIYMQQQLYEEQQARLDAEDRCHLYKQQLDRAAAADGVQQ